MATNIAGIDTTAASTITKKDEKKNGDLDKEAFLKLLVTQMQYQDPLEPTDNTEYMSQLAQYSELESMNNMSNSFSQTQAMNLVGQYVLLNTKTASGAIEQVGGLVEYVTISNNQALLRVNGTYYSMDEFDSVVDLDYVEYMKAQNAKAAESESGSEEEADNTSVDENGA